MPPPTLWQSSLPRSFLDLRRGRRACRRGTVRRRDPFPRERESMASELSKEAGPSLRARPGPKRRSIPYEARPRQHGRHGRPCDAAIGSHGTDPFMNGTDGAIYADRHGLEILPNLLSTEGQSRCSTRRLLNTSRPSGLPTVRSRLLPGGSIPKPRSVSTFRRA